MQRIIRIIVDISITVLFLLCLCYPRTSNRVHEILGVGLFALFIWHNLLNRGWYKTLFRGEWPLKRIGWAAVNLLLLADMVGLGISGVMLSRDVFAFLGLSGSWSAKQYHTFFAYWGLLLVAVHLGLHLKQLFSPLGLKLSTKARRLMHGAATCVILAGIYEFISFRLFERLAFQAFFLSVPKQMTLPGLFMRLAVILSAIALLTHYAVNIYLKEKKC
ncbi:DUF4405 domain-containing protein [Candidatus Avelusimicrobium stercoris]|uniref:DUF4405 domain-containing protein n=1 Tax=Candidatus Avelusimicrobium stercoris TaxID=1947924 RepID=UPI003D14614F